MSTFWWKMWQVNLNWLLIYLITTVQTAMFKAFFLTMQGFVRFAACQLLSRDWSMNSAFVFCQNPSAISWNILKLLIYLVVNGYSLELFFHSNFVIEIAMPNFIYQRAQRSWQKIKVKFQPHSPPMSLEVYSLLYLLYISVDVPEINDPKVIDLSLFMRRGEEGGCCTQKHIG